MAQLILIFYITCTFIDGIVSQGATLAEDSNHQYNYQISSDASKSVTETAFAFNNEVNCLLDKYQDSKGKSCKKNAEVNASIAKTNTLLSETVKSDLPKIKDADTKASQKIAACGNDEVCLYQKRLESYYLILSTQENSLKSIKSIKINGLNEVKTYMDNCVKK